MVVSLCARQSHAWPAVGCDVCVVDADVHAILGCGDETGGLRHGLVDVLNKAVGGVPSSEEGKHREEVIGRVVVNEGVGGSVGECEWR